MSTAFINPITNQDYPDPEVIRVHDTYYMISTTMHFMPGAVILKSYDLQNWEIASYVFDALDHTCEQKLENDQNIYGKGMWAASLCVHNDIFYVLFIANDTHKTYLYQSNNVDGPWQKTEVKGFYHDASLFFDDDERVYIIYGNTDIWLTELSADLTGPKENGMHRLLVTDKSNHNLGYEGSHFYKIDGYYYLFLIHSLKDGFFRTEACFSSDSLDGTFCGGDVFHDDIHFRGAGVAQGGIVDTPNGDWYAIMFQDHGAVGRIPVVLPITIGQGKVVMGDKGKMPERFEVQSTRRDYIYKSLFSCGFLDDNNQLKLPWQWNHEPQSEFYSFDEKNDSLTLRSAKVCSEITQSVNTLTQRTTQPYSSATVSVDFNHIKNGDYVGISAFQGCYGFVAITKENDKNYLVMRAKDGSANPGISWKNLSVEEEYEKIELDFEDHEITLRCETYFEEDKDYAIYSYQKAGKWVAIGPVHNLIFLLDHFCGCRFGLFYYSTQMIGGEVTFREFNYEIMAH